ncbi:MAG: Ycf48-like protein [Ignavibacteria bacterium]|nr:Ycf48-like protein [Ignavibacteria bacterium]
MDNKFLNKLSSLLFYTYIFIFIILVNPSYSQTGWYEQTLPVSGTISDIQFIDSQTGWITLYGPTNLIKTTNSGKSWIILQSGSDQFEHFEFLNDTLGFATGHIGASGQISKTTNGGTNWILTYTGSNYFSDLSFINKDTGYFCGTDGSFAGIWRTTNSGASITRIYTTNFFTIEQIFFLKQNYGGEYYGWWLSSGFMSKTTNSGISWSTPTDTINGLPGDFYWFYFLEKDTGWVVFEPNSNNVKIYKTLDGGVIWTEQVNSDGFAEVRFINQSVGWAGTGSFKIYATKNGGINWGTQVTPIFISQWTSTIDSLTAWTGYTRLAHTTDGGGIITYVGIDPGSTEIPVNFILEQNYPNPFNPQTTIKFSVLNPSSVSLMVYDITGKEILKIYDNEILNPGNYKVSLDFSRRSLSSGTYFYSMKVTDKNSGLLYNETKKMIYLK